MRSRIKRVLSAMFSEDGSVSMVRVMSLFSLIVGAFIAIWGLVAGKDLGGISQLCTVFVAGAFTGKIAQKFAENGEK